MKKILAIMLTLALVLTSCGGTASSGSSSEESALGSAESVDKEKLAAEFMERLSENLTVSDIDIEDQLSEDIPAGATVATLTTTHGDIKIRMFPDVAPKAVENFVTHCKDGYYDGIAFHRVIEDFMIQSGDPNGNGTGGESIWGVRFDDEISDSLHHFRGALAMANAGPNTNGSQFFIVQSDDKIGEDNIASVMLTWYYNEINRAVQIDAANGKYTEDELSALIEALNERLLDANENGVPDEFKSRYSLAAEKYTEIGGTPSLDYGYTVFGQVIEGMDVVDSIAKVEVTESSSGEKSSPVEDVYIISASVAVTE